MKMTDMQLKVSGEWRVVARFLCSTTHTYAHGGNPGNRATTRHSPLVSNADLFAARKRCAHMARATEAIMA